MYRFQVLRLSCDGPQSPKANARPVFLKISSEGQPARRFVLGTFPAAASKTFRSLVHFTATPVTLSLNQGPRHSEQIGVYSVGDFLAHTHRPDAVGTITFATRRASPTYTVHYVAAPVEWEYSFALVSATCLRQWTLTHDRLVADVEFNHSPHGILPGYTNRYHLGRFDAHSIGSVHTGHNLTFSALGHFQITLYVLGKIAEHDLGSLTFEPVDQLEPEDPAAATGGLVWDGGTRLLVGVNDTAITQTVVLSSPNGASYDLTFTLRKLPYHHTSAIALTVPPPLASEALPASGADYSVLHNGNIGEKTTDNDCEILVDGVQTFERYYQAMMQARHSISIIAWELSLAFGLVLADPSKPPLLPMLYSSTPKWITLQDVLLYRALAGVKVRIMIWRHEVLSHLNRFLYLGEVTVEREVGKLSRLCDKLGLTIKVFHTIDEMPGGDSPYASPIGTADDDTNIVVVIVGNPLGPVSCHHEKLLLIDAECSQHAFAYLGGFDIARGRFDQPLHLVPQPFYSRGRSSGTQRRYGDASIQPFLKRIRFLWHDIQIMVRGPAAQQLHLHFAQRWKHAFSWDISKTRAVHIRVPKDPEPCTAHGHEGIAKLDRSNWVGGCGVRVLRCWQGVLDGHIMLDDYCKSILQAKKHLYIEHQYPFQNYALTHCMRQALRDNPELKVIIIAPFKTDLPSGIVGELFDQSQDHINDDLSLIHSTAPERVGIFFLLSQEPNTKELKPIYVHAKFCSVDDQYLVTGSANMDNLSFFRSSELSVWVDSPQLARDARSRLVEEHLGPHFCESMRDDFDKVFAAFHRVAMANDAALRETNTLAGRLVYAVPHERYRFLRDIVQSPSSLSKVWFKMGLKNPLVEPISLLRYTARSIWDERNERVERERRGAARL